VKLTRSHARFARALFEEAASDNVERQIFDEIRAVWAVLAKEADLLKTLAHPKVPRQRRVELARKVLAGTVGPRTADFVALLVDRGRIGQLEGIVAIFEERLLEHEGIVRAHVTTAVPIDDGERKMIESRLAQLTKKQIEASYEIDRMIVGGIVIRLGDRLIDGSVRFHLRRMRDELKSLRLS
jgi:F-type H+-transporting ATPase subunit delta